MINEKSWILFYFTVSFLQTLRDLVGERVNDWHSNGDITYRTRSRIKMGLLISVELVHFIWQIYGNVIYYNQYTDKNVMKCREMINESFVSLMFMIIILGYIYIVLYAVFLLLLVGVYFRRFNNSRQRSTQASSILRSITRVKFSEDLFGAISDENECIICMTSFGPDDLITKLNCEGRHFYHTGCIENWIR
jgi:hypothetical protein